MLMTAAIVMTARIQVTTVTVWDMAVMLPALLRMQHRTMKLTILKCFSETGKTSSSIIQKTMMKAMDLGVDVINMSFCFYTISDENRAAIDSLIAMAVDRNIVMCVAAGNSNGGGESWMWKAIHTRRIIRRSSRSLH